MTKKGMCLAMCLMVAAAAVVVEAAAAPVPCIVTELSPCAGLLLSPGPGAGAAQPQPQPSQECCSRLKEQQPCLCGYINDPILGPYINVVNTRTVSATCGVPVPTC